MWLINFDRMVDRPMQNSAATDTYTFFDHALSRTARSLSFVIGLRRITQPFWARWLSSGVRPEAIFRLLDQLRSIDGWTNLSSKVIDEDVAAFRAVEPGLSPAARVTALRELSYLCNMAQWGSLPITEGRRRIYRLCRDFYIAAESACFPDSYRRVDFPFDGMALHANLHAPADGPARPLIAIIHGVDGCKEEFLSTELALYDAGFAVAGFDGPGQGETLLLEGGHWRPDFSASISTLLDRLAGHPGIDVGRTGVLGISVGGLWAMQAAADDPRIAAIYDLGGPINTARRFASLPFLIKTRICQVTGRHDTASVLAALEQIHIEDDALIGRIAAAVRSMHGGQDRVVSLADKNWLHERLQKRHPACEASLRILEAGDHCCTGQAGEVRRDMLDFLTRVLRPRD